MNTIDERNQWELLILEGNSPSGRMSSVAAGDIDGDGRVEIVSGGDGLVWYRPETQERGVILEPGSTFVHGGMKLVDIDDDGLLEIVSGESPSERDSQGGGKSLLTWYKPQKDLNLPWARSVIEPDYPGYAHDLVVADLDGSGDKKVVAISVYSATLGVYVYARKADIRQPWTQNIVSKGYFADGTSVGDVDGDGIMEIICGPDLYKAPAAGVMAGPWRRSVLAPNFRDMCLTTLVDITKNGRPDIVITEAEFMNGRISWFENRMTEDPGHPWVEHPLQDDMVFAHSLFTRDNTDSISSFVVGEMERGGWYPPYNHDARLIEFATADGGKNWTSKLISRGEGTHQAIQADIDGDGEKEIIGESNGQYFRNPRVQVWKNRHGTVSPIKFKHRFIDREKPGTGDFLLTGDIDGDGLEDVICGKWWYRSPDYIRREIPGISQVLCLYDVDEDGQVECIAELQEKGRPAKICWLKSADPANGNWETHVIGSAAGHRIIGALAAAVLPGDKPALLLSSQAENEYEPAFPELFEIPDSLKNGPWKKRVLAEIPYGGILELCDIDVDGKPDIIAGPWWLKNCGDGTFRPFRYAPEDFEAGGAAIMDVNGDGRPDIILGQHKLDPEGKMTPWSKVLWFENPTDPGQVPWTAHGVDSLRCVHSFGVCDLDGDGLEEIICGEHDPIWQYRNRCRLVIYKKGDARGLTWTKQVVDDRFEHYNGVKILRSPSGKPAILSHGQYDTKYICLWEVL